MFSCCCCFFFSSSIFRVCACVGLALVVSASMFLFLFSANVTNNWMHCIIALHSIRNVLCCAVSCSVSLINVAAQSCDILCYRRILLLCGAWFGVCSNQFYEWIPFFACYFRTYSSGKNRYSWFNWIYHIIVSSSFQWITFPM